MHHEGQKCELSLARSSLCLQLGIQARRGIVLTPRVPVTHSGWFDAKLALPIHQAVLNDGKEARVSVCGADANNGGAQVYIFKHRLLQTQNINTSGCCTNDLRF